MADRTYEVLIAIQVTAPSREDAEDVANDVADWLPDEHHAVDGANALLLSNDDHYDMLGIKRGGEPA